MENLTSGGATLRGNLKECQPRCVYQNYSRSMIKELQSKNITIFVCTMTYQLHVSAVS